MREMTGVRVSRTNEELAGMRTGKVIESLPCGKHHRKFYIEAILMLILYWAHINAPSLCGFDAFVGVVKSIISAK